MPTAQHEEIKRKVRETYGGADEIDRLLAFMAETNRGVCRKTGPEDAGEAGQM